MTKTAIRKENFRNVKNLLIDKYNAYSIDNEGSFFSMFIDFEDFTLQCQLTRDCDFGSYDSIKLSGDGWTEEEIAKQAAAERLEEVVEKEIEEITTKEVARPE